MTHQDIADEMARISEAREAARKDFTARQRREFEPLIKALQDECGKVGHVFGIPAFSLFPIGRICQVCGLLEPKSEPSVTIISGQPGKGA